MLQSGIFKYNYERQQQQQQEQEQEPKQMFMLLANATRICEFFPMEQKSGEGKLQQKKSGVKRMSRRKPTNFNPRTLGIRVSFTYESLNVKSFSP